MDIFRTKRAYRFIPLGAAATLLLWAFARFGVTDHSTYRPGPDQIEDFYPPPPPPHHFPPPFGGAHPPPGGPPPHVRPTTVWSERADAVKNAFLHAYRGYQEYAGSHDELLPVSDAYVDKYVPPRLLMAEFAVLICK